MGHLANALVEFARRVLGPFDLAPSRHAPFVVRRYRPRGYLRPLENMAPDLAVPVEWKAEASVPALEPGLSEILFSTHKWVHYLPVYERTLSPLRGRPVRLLEIGVSRGGSLQLWRRYLHPESTVVGIDIEPDCARFDDPKNRVHVRIGSQADLGFLRKIVDELGPFDVVVDDGSHMASHMIETFRYLFAHGLQDGGVYIVEDMHTNYWTPWRDSKLSFVDFAKSLVDVMHAHYLATTGELEFRLGLDARRESITVPELTTWIDAIEFYDSMAVIRRSNGRRSMPMTVMR